MRVASPLFRVILCPNTKDEALRAFKPTSTIVGSCYTAFYKAIIDCTNRGIYMNGRIKSRDKSRNRQVV
jgi:hypothetical protein